jgi:hydroxymethylpyrimidine pyrophosphatase-like HAD family hydrolase
MIFKALACGYDGTLASEDRLGPDALAALRKAREAGVWLILVTGRTFFELTRVCEHLDLFDGVVAENGGVLYFPAAATIKALAPPPPPQFLAELDRRGVAYQLGHVVVGTARGDEAVVRAALAEVGASLALVYNRTALMVLPAGVGKGSGTEQALRAFGLSSHDVLALGDAENDLDLFDACGWAGCPASPVPELLRRADWSFPGEDGAAIARAIVGPILNGLLPLDRSARQRIDLGWAARTNQIVSIPSRGVNVLVHGDPSSGKSWFAGVLVERLRERRYAVCVIDPEGEYGALARLPGVSLVEAHDAAAVDAAFRRFEADPAACVVIDLVAFARLPKKVEMIERCLLAARDTRRRLGLPHWIVVDEAHYSLHREGVAERALAIEDKGFCLVTYKPSWLRPSATNAVDVLILARATGAHELAFLGSFLTASGGCSEGVIPALADLAPGEFLLMKKETGSTWLASTFTAPHRATSHVRHLKKYSGAAVRPEHAFLFRSPNGHLEATADSLDGFRRIVTTASDAALGHHAGRGDFSRWIRDVFSDRELAAQLRKAERRWGRGEIPHLGPVIDELIATRYWSEREGAPGRWSHDPS